MIPSSRVFDLSSIEPSEHDAQGRSPIKKRLDNGSSADDAEHSPDGCSTDSESSVSSYTSNASSSTATSGATPRRSVFHKYWRHTGQE
eukprot:CAMPEP_0117058636 /NCGR_PEP_ID=MMETSP0472-20121206/40738_1 /TAXON_ID=693140 ORGANISM="Tiarina fusus, Strain LIS" /NCGR_SAMPLE_ID=MMETSP0472 /ASSEMBLY_ACC=CAM_ASM_000603 /LENGTH=87 /DNA_ID=CAMNT_0004776047 /DNA_START=128 /DNA_END=388 /DNA_ORIENTATION=-